MSRHIRISCPHCKRSGLRIRPEHLGRHVQCKHCGKGFESVAEDEPSSFEVPRPAAHFGGQNGSASASTNGVESVSKTTENLEAVRQLGDARDQIVRLHDVQRHLQDQLDAARAQLLEASNGRRDDHEHQAAEASHLAESLQVVQAEAERLRAALDDARTAAEAVARDRDMAETERARLERDLTGLREETDRIQHELKNADTHTLQARVAAESIAIERDRAEAERARLEQAALAIRGDFESIRREHKDSSRLAGERAGRDALALEEARSRASAADRLAQTLRNELEQLSAKLAEQERVHEEAALHDTENESEAIRRLAHELMTERAERARLEAALLDARSEHGNELARFQKALDHAAGEREASALNVSELQDELEQARSRNDEAERRERTLQEIIDQAAKQRAASEQIVATLRDEIEEVRSHNDEAERRERTLRDDHTAGVAGLREAIEEAAKQRAASEQIVATLRDEIEEVRSRNDEAERHERALRDELERLVVDHQAARSQDERTLLALRQDVEAAQARAEAERKRVESLTEAMVDLEQRLGDAIDELNGAPERAEWAESEVRALPDRHTNHDQIQRDDDDAIGGHPQDLLRQLQDARQANQRLSALLNVFGMSKDAPAGCILGRIEPTPNAAAPAAAPQ